MKNNGKPSKTKENEKKNEVANEKKMKNLDSKLQILTPNQEIFKNSRKFFIIFFIFFFIFPFPWHLKSRKTMKNNEKTMEKPSKTKENEKKNEVANEKKMKIWTQSCRFSLRTRKSSKTRKFSFFIFFSFFSFFHFFSFSLPVAPEIQESHEKQ